MAFGSLILAFTWVFRLVFEYLDSKIDEGNEVCNLFSKCCRCCLDCFHRFIKFLNDNAYVQVALQSENFCSSAMLAFVLSLKHSATFVITHGIGTIIHFLGKLTITLVNVTLAYLMLENFTEFEELESPIAPLIIVSVMSFLMANIFMQIYGITSLTILQCLYTDVDIQAQKKVDPMNNNNRPAEMEEVVKMLKKEELQ